jgi:hypothetical protein
LPPQSVVVIVVYSVSVGLAGGVCSSSVVVVVQGVLVGGGGAEVSACVVVLEQTHEQAEETASMLLPQSPSSVGMASGAVVVPARKSMQKLTPTSAPISAERFWRTLR